MLLVYCGPDHHERHPCACDRWCAPWRSGLLPKSMWRVAGRPAITYSGYNYVDSQTAPGNSHHIWQDRISPLIFDTSRWQSFLLMAKMTQNHNVLDSEPHLTIYSIHSIQLALMLLHLFPPPFYTVLCSVKSHPLSPTVCMSHCGRGGTLFHHYICIFYACIQSVM